MLPVPPARPVAPAVPAITLTASTSYRLAAALAVVSALLLFVVSQGVGLIGADGDPTNRVYLGVLALGVLGAIGVRFRASGMAAAMVVVAVAVALIGLVAAAAGWGTPYSPPLEVLGLTAGVAGLFGASAWLFRRAAAGA